ncbi:MAG: lipoprotein insertase outer membrane protein LolB [Tahibacter sp.]
MRLFSGVPLLRFSIRAGLAGLLLSLAACAPLRTHGDPAGMAAQTDREHVLQSRPRWSLVGRIAVSNGEDGGNAQVEWMQVGESCDLRVTAPVTGKTWHLAADQRQATLDGVGATRLTDRTAATLLEREVGWHIPVAQLQYWVRAMRSPESTAELVFDAQHVLTGLVQSGWTVEYRDYFVEGEPRLPRKVFASRGKQRVRLYIERWQEE